MDNSRTPRILLMNPWIEDFAAYDFWAKPLGLLRIASWLRSHNIDFYFLDCLDMTHPVHSEALPEKPQRTRWGSGKYYKYPLEVPGVLSHVPRQWSGYGLPREYIIRYLESLETPDVILIHTSMTYWYTAVQKLVNVLRRLFPRATIMLGGIYATLCHQHATEVFQPNYVHSGYAFELLRQYFSEHWNLSLPVPDILSLPYPASLYPGSDLGVLSLSSGCSFQCAYCASHFLHPFYQKARLPFIKEQLSQFKASGIKNITFYDDDLLNNSGDLLLPLLEWAEKQGYQFNYHLSNGVNLKSITPEIAHSFKRHNFVTLRLGFETVDSRQQKKLGSKVDNSDFIYGVKALHEAGYSQKEIGIFLLAGYPGQTKEELYDSINFVYDNGGKPYISEYSPIPKTSLWKESCEISRYPLEQEPLFHNSSIFPCEWENFKRKDLYFLKTYCRKHVV